jgi:uncharacterized iron-regulated membrane protein
MPRFARPHERTFRVRTLYVLIHRWLGLSIAAFVIVAGLTGAVISWDQEIDAWLNADIMRTQTHGPMRDPLDLAARVLASDPRIEISYMPLALEPGHAAGFLVHPRMDPATGAPFRLDYDNVFVDPVTGRITGRRDSQAVSFSRRNLMPFLRSVHESLHLPAFGGTDRWGYRITGGVALLWVLDSLVAFCLTWPPRTKKTAPAPGRPPMRWLRRWKPSWQIRQHTGGYKLNFDLHRAVGLWIWGVILIIAFTSFSLNLYREVFYPALSLVSRTTPGPYETQTPAPYGARIAPKISFAQAIAIAREEARRRGFEFPPAGIYYGGGYRFYNVSFFDPADETGAQGMGLSNLYIDADDGSVLGQYRPWHGTAADVFVQLQLPLHSGRILGVTGRILMSILGLAVALLAITGIVIWNRKRKARGAGARTRPYSSTPMVPNSMGVRE